MSVFTSHALVQRRWFHKVRVHHSFSRIIFLLAVGNEAHAYYSSLGEAVQFSHSGLKHPKK